ncbi:pre-mRNA-splicing factor prp46 [Jimgerdemannia flammicorona]|uniref:Pre-mRNA-splicing factor prp46 n=1 Tax=Jimgerdemannia flammicorona TaxID=994334 RepID=A0A433A0I7_9FUNG|nr:pre-mRNA-splicing factor prp46 [Jimgerdemannia flammicorona]
MRTKRCVHVLSGHTTTVAEVKCQEVDPQVITASMDSTIRLWDLAAGKTMATLTHHKKSVRGLALHPTEFAFASASADNIKTWKCPQGNFIQNFEGHQAIVNTLAINSDGVVISGGDWGKVYCFAALDSTFLCNCRRSFNPDVMYSSPGDNGSMAFWDWKSGYKFQSVDTLVQPGSLESEAGIFASIFDQTGTRFITCEADKTIKIWREDDNATEETHPIDWKPSLIRRRY